MWSVWVFLLCPHMTCRRSCLPFFSEVSLSCLAISWMCRNLLSFPVPPSDYIVPGAPVPQRESFSVLFPFPQFLSFTEACEKELAGGCKLSLYLGHPGILNYQGSSHLTFSNSLKLHLVIFSACVVAPSSFALPKKQAACVQHSCGDVTYWILVY